MLFLRISSEKYSRVAASGLAPTKMRPSAILVPALGYKSLASCRDRTSLRLTMRCSTVPQLYRQDARSGGMVFLTGLSTMTTHSRDSRSARHQHQDKLDAGRRATRSYASSIPIQYPWLAGATEKVMPLPLCRYCIAQT